MIPHRCYDNLNNENGTEINGTVSTRHIVANAFKDLYLSGDTFVGEPSTIGAGETGVTVRGLGSNSCWQVWQSTSSATLVSFNNSNGEVGEYYHKWLIYFLRYILRLPPKD